MNNLQAYRSDANKNPADEGTFATLIGKLVFSSIGGQNAGTIKGRVYEKGTTAPGWTTMADNTLVLFGGSLSIEKIYTAEISINDLITSYQYSIDIPTATVIMGIAPNGDGVSFGMYPEAGKLKSAWPVSVPSIVIGNNTNLNADLLDGNHASAFAAASHGHSSFTRPVGTNVSPDSQSLMLNGSVSNNSDIVNAPGLGFHIPGINWMTLKMASDSSLRAYNSALNGYVPFFASVFYEDGVAISAKYAPLLSYPVGAIYMSYASTSPATLFGGTWSALPTGRFLRTGTGGSTGGSDTHVHSTAAVALTIGQMPYHNHPIWDLNWEVATGAGGPIATYGGAKNSPSGYAGGNEAHGHGNTGSASNVPAYYEVYAWRRTA